jgi:hypothetical protein
VLYSTGGKLRKYRAIYTVETGSEMRYIKQETYAESFENTKDRRSSCDKCERVKM